MQMRGKAGRGEKTMLDVLIPVSETFSRLSSDGASQSAILEALKAEAQRGMEATKDLIATKGRASFLGERAIGHIDPGARSSQLIIAAVCDLFAAPAVTETRGVPVETRAAG
jgi:phosphoenolpyruvate---glycerone phosphotransferase subunit DhaL